MAAPRGNSNAAKVPKPPRRVQDDIRSKIQAGNLINRLEKHIVGKISLENSQLKAIEILLDRSIPKLSAVELTGKDGEAIKHAHEVNVFFRGK